VDLRKGNEFMELIDWRDEDDEENNVQVTIDQSETTTSETIVGSSETTDSKTTKDSVNQFTLICQSSSSSMSSISNNSQIETAIRVILFSGNKEYFEAWLEEFRAKGKRTGFKEQHYAGTAGEILKSSYDTDADINLSDDEKKALKKLKEDTELVFTKLLLLIDTSTLQGKIAFKCIMGTKASDYPDGHAGNGIARLIQKYLPKSALTLVKLHKEFYNSLTS
jgi:hypothetical protein